MSSTTTSLTVSGYLTTTSPLHIASPGTMRFDPATGRPVYTSKAGLPCTPTRSMEFRLPASVLETLPEAEERWPVLRLPVLPAQGLRGRLRRIAARSIEDALRERGERLSWASYQVLHCGAASGNPASETPSLTTVRAQAGDALLGLFGGGPYMLRGALRVANGYPTVAYLIDLGVIPRDTEDVIDNTHVRSLFSYEPIVRVDDAGQYRDDQAHEIITNYEDEMLELLGKTAQARARRLEGVEQKDGEEAVARASTRAMSYVQCVRPGTPFHVSFSVRNATAAQAGLLLTSVASLVNDPVGLGGKTAVGYGAVHASRFSVTVEGGTPIALFTGDHHALNTDATLIAEFVQAHDATLDSVRAADIDALVRVA